MTATPSAQRAQADLDHEKELVLRAKSMDEDAWDALLRAYYPRLCTYLTNRVGNRAVGEDLASEVFAEAVSRIGSYEWRGLPFGAWIFRIARNIGTNYVRKQARQAGIAHEPTPAPSAVDLAERDLERTHLERALTTLTDEQRQVLTLRFINDLTTAETAAVLGKREGAVKAIQHRGLAAARRALNRIDPTLWRLDHATT